MAAPHHELPDQRGVPTVQRRMGQGAANWRDSIRKIRPGTIDGNVLTTEQCSEAERAAARTPHTHSRPSIKQAVEAPQAAIRGSPERTIEELRKDLERR